MATTLIVTKSRDENFNQTGEQIIIDDWVGIVEGDPMLALRTEPYVMRLPDGKELCVPVRPAQSELIIAGQHLPFLGYFEGELMMKFTTDMNSPDNPKRRKVAEIARQLGALVTHDAGDEILKW